MKEHDDNAKLDKQKSARKMYYKVIKNLNVESLTYNEQEEKMKIKYWESLELDYDMNQIDAAKDFKKALRDSWINAKKIVLTCHNDPNN